MIIGWKSEFLGIAAVVTGMALTGPATGEGPAPNAGQTGQFSGTSITQTKAIIFEIDVEHNSVALLQENGESIEVVVDRSVGDVSTLNTGDTVSITYRRALLLRADKSASNGIRERIDSGFTTAQSVGSSTSMHRIQAITTVERIDREKRQLTLRGPTSTVTMEASSDGLLDGINVGDSVRVDFVEATAIRISRDGVPVR
ncbi:hypothetical protein SAMN05446935_7450 [Burkholderia sp. YR290]|nr:hypothetical protein SAMN05446935_7450 [Burkholderia sp. YR290]